MKEICAAIRAGLLCEEKKRNNIFVCTLTIRLLKTCKVLKIQRINFSKYFESHRKLMQVNNIKSQLLLPHQCLCSESVYHSNIEAVLFACLLSD